MVDLSSLKDLPSEAVGWAPLTYEKLAGPDLFVCTFDQSLNSTGFVEVFREDGSIYIGRVETIKPPDSDLSGFEEDYEAALFLEDRARYLIGTAPQGSVIVFETPLVPNAMMMKKMGTRAGVPGRMGGQAIHSAAHYWHRTQPGPSPRMVNSQQCKKLVCGNPKADKNEAHDALRQLTWIVNLEAALKNEHTRDATLLGLNILSKEH